MSLNFKVLFASVHCRKQMGKQEHKQGASEKKFFITKGKVMRKRIN